MDGFQALPADPEEMMRVVMVAWAAGDLGPLAAAVHKDVVWKSAPLGSDDFRFGGVYQRRTGVMDVTHELATEYKAVRFVPMEITARNDVVWGLFDVDMKYQPVGDTRVYPLVRLDMAVRWRLEDGKIIEHQTFYDTAALLRQRGDLGG